MTGSAETIHVLALAAAAPGDPAGGGNAAADAASTSAVDAASAAEKELEAAGLSCRVHRAGDRDAYLREMLSAKPDLILHDDALASPGCLEAVRMLQQYHPDIPFIILASPGREPEALDCIGAGADDFVLKGEPGRLACAVRSALRRRSASGARRNTETALRESEKRFQWLFESAREGILLLDSGSGRITDANPFTMEFIGAPAGSVIGRTLAEAGFIPFPAVYALFLDRLGQEGFARYEGAVSSAAGRSPVAELECSRTRFEGRDIVLCSLRDVTGRKLAEDEKDKIQQQLFQSQKMEAIGAVVGGVAHDFNNLMTAIQISADLALMKTDESNELAGELKEIRNSALRATGLIRQLLLFSRKHPMEFRTLAVNPIIENLLRMLHRLIGEDIEIRTELDPDLFPVRADASNMEQVIMNFVLNARDAMPSGGTVTIRTANAVLSERECRDLPDVKAGSYAVLSVADTGTGMTPDVIERIFEPFFTTKPAGQGTGLGLSVVYGIVRQHEGAVHISSEPGRGSVFTVYLPAAAVPAESASESRVRTPERPGRGQRILLVEDEDKVRESAAKALLKCGYRVTVADSVQSAWDQVRRENGAFDLVFTDVVLSDRTGIDLADDILRQYPGTRILLCSGYTDQKSQWPIILEREFRFLQKPYDLNALLRAVEESLGAAGTNHSHS
ncbi:MAG: response regulator [bacterium]|nr:response regulator [bacterium]